MKRTLSFLLVLFFELVISVFLLTSNSQILGFSLFFLNLLLFLLLFKEPYWKIGAFLVMGVFIEVMLYFLNFVYFNWFLLYTSLFNILTLSFGFFIVFIAHRIKALDYVPDEFTLDKPKEKVTQSKEKTPTTPKKKAFILVDKTIHLDTCSEISKIPEENRVVIGSKKYAETKGNPCHVCKPFG
jgi:hypothetical protein